MLTALAEIENKWFEAEKDRNAWIKSTNTLNSANNMYISWAMARKKQLRIDTPESLEKRIENFLGKIEAHIML